MTGRRGWLIRVLLLEKTVQHVFVTWVFATARFDFREDVVLDYRLFLYSGGVVAVLFGVAFLGHLAARRWSLTLAGGLAAFDIVGEFVAQGGVIIVITVSFLVALLLLLLVVLKLRTLPGKARSSRIGTTAAPAESFRGESYVGLVAADVAHDRCRADDPEAHRHDRCTADPVRDRAEECDQGERPDAGDASMATACLAALALGAQQQPDPEGNRERSDSFHTVVTCARPLVV